jgi:hypothetical protein
MLARSSVGIATNIGYDVAYKLSYNLSRQQPAQDPERGRADEHETLFDLFGQIDYSGQSQAQQMESQDCNCDGCFKILGLPTLINL